MGRRVSLQKSKDVDGEELVCITVFEEGLGKKQLKNTEYLDNNYYLTRSGNKYVRKGERH